MSKKTKIIDISQNRDLDQQRVWRGKDQQDWSDMVVHAPPRHIQEKVHPKVDEPVKIPLREHLAGIDGVDQKEARIEA